MNVTQRLEMHKGSISVLNNSYSYDVKDLLERTPHSEADTIFVSGSLIEGVGNYWSDLDAYVVCDELPRLVDIDPKKHHWLYSSATAIATSREGNLHQIFDYLDPGHIAWDVEYWTTEQVDQLITRIERIYQDSLSHTRDITGPSYRECGFIHRLSRGIVLNNLSAFDQIVDRVPFDKYRYICYRRLAGGYSRFRDIKGSWWEKDFVTALHMARQHLFQQAFAFTYLAGNTSGNSKWVFKFISNLPSEFDQLKAAFLGCFSGNSASEKGLKGAILKCLDCIDSIYLHSSRLIDANPAFVGTERSLILVDREQAERADDHLEIRRQFSYRRKLFGSGEQSSRQLLLEY